MTNFDTVLVDFVLPNPNHARITDWRTQTLGNTGAIYVFDENGLFLDEDGDADFTGQVRIFHSSQEYGHVEYVVRVKNGKMTEIEEIKPDNYWRYYGTT